MAGAGVIPGKIRLVVGAGVKIAINLRSQGRFTHSRLEYRAISVWNFPRRYSLSLENRFSIPASVSRPGASFACIYYI